MIDLGGATLLPGLIDLHTHLTSTGVHWEDELLKTTPGQAALHGAHNALVTLMAGFTTCRDMGPTWPYTDIDLRKAIDEGVVPGPRLLAAGNYVSPTGGAGDARQFSIYVDVPIVRNLADGPDEIRKAVRTNLKQGADFIKILGTGAVLSKGAPPGRAAVHARTRCMSPSKRPRAGADTSRRTCTEPTASRRPIRAGVHTIDHGSMMDDEAVELMREHTRRTSCRRCTPANPSPRIPTCPSPRSARSQQIEDGEGPIVSARFEVGRADRVRDRRGRHAARPERARIRLSRAARPVADGRHRVGDPDGRRDHRLERSRRHDRSTASSPISSPSPAIRSATSPSSSGSRGS